MKTNRLKSWTDPTRTLGQSPGAVYLGSLGAGSRRTMQQSLVSLAAIVAGDGADPVRLRWEKLRRADTVAIRTELRARFAPATANKMLSALRGVLRTARRMNLIAESDYQTAASLEQIAAAVPAPPRNVGNKELAKLFDACVKRDNAAHRRDAALLAIFLSTGLRRTEAAMLDVADYDAGTGRLHIRGERPEYDRLVDLPVAARAAVRHWLALRSDEPGPLILPVDRGGLIRFRRLTDQAVYDILGRIAARAALPAITGRDLRRAYVISLIRSGKDLREVQYLTGHASWITTTSYEALSRETTTGVYDLDRLPYKPPRGPRP